MNKAVFLDRDGVVNLEKGDYTYKAEDFIINPGIIESIKLLRENGFIVIIITNQGGIAKNLYSDEDVFKTHKKLYDELKKENTDINDIYYCPHHHDVSKCLCRKPESLMLEKAIAVYNIDTDKSFMFGDNERDIKAAEKVNVKGILIAPNENILKYCKQIINNE